MLHIPKFDDYLKIVTELKKFKVQAILVLDYKKRNDCKIFHWSTKLTANELDIDEAFTSIHRSIIKK